MFEFGLKSKKQHFLLLSVCGMIAFLFWGALSPKPYMNVYYLMDLKDGIASRMIVGTMLHLVFGSETHLWQIYLFYLFFIIATYCISALFFSKVLNSYPNDSILLLIVCAFVVGPFYFRYHCAIEAYGRFDLYMLFLVILGCWICTYKIGTVLKLIILCGLTIVGFAVHTVFLSIYFPLFLSYVLYLFFEKKQKWYAWFTLVGAAIVISCAYVYFQFIGKLHVPTYDEMKTILEARAMITIDCDNAIEYVFYKGLKENFTDIVIAPHEVNHFVGIFARLQLLAGQLVLLLPILVSILLPLREWFRKKKARVLFLIPFILLTLLPYIVAVDWCRWLASLLTEFFLGFCLLLYEKDTDFLRVWKKMRQNLYDNPIMLVSLLCYLVLLETLSSSATQNNTSCLITNVPFVGVSIFILVIIYSILLWRALNGRACRFELNDRIIKCYQNSLYRAFEILMRRKKEMIVICVCVLVFYLPFIVMGVPSMAWITVPYLITSCITCGYYLLVRKYWFENQMMSTVQKVLRCFIGVVVLVFGLWLCNGKSTDFVYNTIMYPGNLTYTMLLPIFLSLLCFIDLKTIRRLILHMMNHKRLVIGFVMILSLIPLGYGYIDNNYYTFTWDKIIVSFMNILWMINLVGMIVLCFFKEKKQTI